MADVIDELIARGLIEQHSDLETIRAELADGPVTFYCGFDPTAASLHHGHLVQAILMRHLQNAGHHPLVLVGGATGLIGDPRDSGERVLNPVETVAQWVQSIESQLRRLLVFDGDNPARVVNNYDWTSQIDAIGLLRDIGKHFRMGTMLAKDTVRRRLDSEEGISYTEFSYQILQANDYLELHRRYGCTLQTGGNDQWGNLVGGMDLIRKVEGATVHVMTTPLITKADGTKFGKSEGGAIWLNPDMLSPYAFYQFWLNVADAEIEKLLKVFTFIPLDEIEQIVAESAEKPFLRLGQKRLAEEVTAFVHGREAMLRVQEAAAALFGRGELADLGERTLRDAVAELPGAQAALGDPLVDVLVAVGLEQTKSAARRTLAGGGLSISNVKVDAEDRTLSEEDVLPGGVVLLRKGKKNLGVAYVGQ